MNIFLWILGIVSVIGYVGFYIYASFKGVVCFFIGHEPYVKNSLTGKGSYCMGCKRCNTFFVVDLELDRVHKWDETFTEIFMFNPYIK